MMFKQEWLAWHCSYQIGGVTHFFAAPGSYDELITVIQQCKVKGLHYFIFGLGSNVLFPDDLRDDQAFISLKRLVYWENRTTRWFVSAGVPMSMLAIAGLLHNITDFELTYLLPGSLGAGIYMNAKYNQLQISEIIERVYYIDLDRDDLFIQSISVSECQYGYKKSIFQKHNWLILGADMKVIPSGDQDYELQMVLRRWLDLQDPSHLGTFYTFFAQELQLLADKGRIIPETLKSIERYRMSKYHFTYPSSGSVFKNNYDVGTPIGALVDQLNLKGLTQGGAMISPHHGNIIINVNRASARDIEYLMQVIMNEIHIHFGFVPELEVVQI
ncbi:UDP-N-acetylmuramate dehydrogenase [Paenibacillus guangzhouensis]|uniref:UDP-N-acetylmuramate dehydrogenase n=1 Tax=Paenibacillus guangzhouensis TaxID=1473112 RepID=UPI001D0F68C4|nr:UDP-N-acetylmuramate dehydrogenase [Paenibacillus guangzhouensis]